MGRLGAVGAAGYRNGKYCEGLLTSGQGLFDKVGLITCSCYLLSSLKSWICTCEQAALPMYVICRFSLQDFMGFSF